MPAQPSAAFLALLAEQIIGQAPIVVIGTTATASQALTALGDMTGVAIGATITGLDVVTSPPTKLAAVSNLTATGSLSQSATTGHVGIALSFFNPPLVTLEVGLFTGAPALSPATLLTDLTQPTYAGYAIQAAEIGAIRGDAGGDVIIPIGTSTWQPTGAVSPPQTITGFFVREVGSATLLMSEYLPTPWVANGPLAALDVIDEIYIPAQQVWGGICTTCSP